MQSTKRLLAPADLARLQKLCGLFSSDHAGERANAASLADRFLRDRGWQWTDVISTPKPQANSDDFAKWGSWQGAAQYCLRHSNLLTVSQRGFCTGLLLYAPFNGLTAGQQRTLWKLLNKVGERRAAWE